MSFGIPWAGQAHRGRRLRDRAPAGERRNGAHKVPIVHRDLKSGNVFVYSMQSQSLAIKRFDFGIAKLWLRPTSSLTRRPALR